MIVVKGIYKTKTNLFLPNQHPDIPPPHDHARYIPQFHTLPTVRFSASLSPPPSPSTTTTTTISPLTTNPPSLPPPQQHNPQPLNLPRAAPAPGFYLAQLRRKMLVRARYGCAIICEVEGVDGTGLLGLLLLVGFGRVEGDGAFGVLFSAAFVLGRGGC